MKNGIVLYNAFSGNKQFPQYLDYLIEKAQMKNITLTFYRFEKNTDLLDEILLSQKFDIAIIAGGDGSVNIGINHILKNNLDIPIGIIPIGTCNDFANCINIPQETTEAIDIIMEEKIKNVDVGIINNEKYFTSTFAAGGFAGISFDTSHEVKEAFGPFAYYIAAVSEMINLNTFHLEISANGKTYSEEALLLLVVNGKQVGGLQNLVHTADITDGYMDIIIVKNLLHINIPAMLVGIINNDFLNDKNVMVLKAKECKISSINKNVSVSIDGEKGAPMPVEIKFLSNKLRVFVG